VADRLARKRAADGPEHGPFLGIIVLRNAGFGPKGARYHHTNKRQNENLFHKPSTDFLSQQLVYRYNSKQHAVIRSHSQDPRTRFVPPVSKAAHRGLNMPAEG
jgi:hypothetical protein